MRSYKNLLTLYSSEVLMGMGFVERTKQAEADTERTRLDLENRYSRWQHAAFTLNQTLDRYIFDNTELRSRLNVREEVRHVTDPFLKTRKQLDRLVIIQKTTDRTITLEALPLSPPIFGASGRVDIAAPHLVLQEFYIVWDGGGELPNNWTVKSQDKKFNERLSERSFDEFLGRVFPAS